jgi:diguanylate cyclase (GGDEF)-like protein/PAS domain S-box-containing protein
VQQTATPSAGVRELIDRRAGSLFQARRIAIFREADQLFAALLTFQWLAGIVVALLISPRACACVTSRVHLHVWAAAFLGGAIVSLPVALALFRPGRVATRHAIAAGQSLMGALLIHLTGGRIETHFHIFGSLALLAFYRDWRVLLTSSLVVALDHLLRGMFWPDSIYGTLAVEPGRWAEHSGWVVFVDIFLIRSCVMGVREMHAIADRQAELEVTREGIEVEVRERTADLRGANRSLAEENAERGRVEVALRRLAAIVESSDEIIVSKDLDGVITSWNSGAERVLGYSAAEVLGRHVSMLIPPEAVDDMQKILGRIRRDEHIEHYQTRRRRKDGAIIDVSLTVSPIRDAAGEIVGASKVGRDITEEKRAEAILAHQATHDELTGLPNRALLLRHLDRLASTHRGAEARCALLLIDLDRFKQINDTFGHPFGDEVLKRLNPLLVGAVRNPVLVARLGGDEFGILLEDVAEPDALRIADRILADLASPIEVEGQLLDIGASLGIALYPDHGTDASSLLQRADIAMYAAKRRRTGKALYSSELSDCTPRRLTLVAELRRGIEEGQLLLHYQPKVDLATGEVAGFEALVRWLHPREGLIPPEQFIPMAEETGMIRPMGLWTLKAAIRQCRAWHDVGLDVNVAVNLSADNLLDERLTETVRKLLEGAQVHSRWLTIEVTETAMMNRPEDARRILASLHELGARISIDDFGTGYSSLAYLKDLPVDEVKVDRSFVKDMMVDNRAACIVRTVIDLGHNLGLKVVAEGVEDPASLERLVSWGCDLAQGYYLSRPLPAPDIATWLAGRGTPALMRDCRHAASAPQGGHHVAAVGAR